MVAWAVLDVVALVDAVAGKGACGGFDVCFGVVAFAEGEELEEFSGEVFVWFAGGAFVEVEVADHGGLLGDGAAEVWVWQL